MRRLAEVVPFIKMIEDVHQRPIFDAWDYAIRIGTIRLYGRPGPGEDLVHIRETTPSALVIEYSTQRALKFVSDSGVQAEWLDLHLDDVPQVAPAPPHYDPPLHGMDGRLVVENGSWLHAERVALNQVVASFQLPPHVGSEISNIWDELADAYPEDHPYLTIGVPTKPPISQTKARKQLQTIENAALQLLEALRSTHPLVAGLVEDARSQSGSVSILPDYGTMAGLVGALEYVARSAQKSDALASLPSQLPQGRPADRLADALAAELVEIWHAYTGKSAGSKEVPGKGDEPDEGGRFVIAVGEVLLGPGRIRPRRLR